MNEASLSPSLSPAEARQIDHICDHFEVAWQESGRPSLEEHLNRVGEPVRPALLRQLLLLDWEYRLRAGDNPRAADYHARFPGDGDVIEAVCREISDSPTSAFVEAARASPSASAVTHHAQVPEELGEYRLLREIGRGGMGMVYEAVQEPLGRRVALKLLRWHGVLDATGLERFRREARAAAQLHHTNIVPVYGVGEDHGFHYYAMHFIDAQSLAAVIRELRSRKGLEDRGRKLENQATPAQEAGVTIADQAAASDTSPPAVLSSIFETRSSIFRTAAQLGVQVAEALEYAHRQGILHRDIKPSNLLVDVQGNVWVTDFGLAKAEGSDPLTHTGDVVGTLAYMAPERFHGWSDPRSDVYGLGATLYELLTLRPAFHDLDRVRLMQRVIHDEPPPPRKLVPDIPRDLETIVLTATAKEPGHRYQTAGALAEDLRRFLADRPIQARRTPWRERAWRWCRRNPALAAVSAALLALLVSGFAVVTTLWLVAENRRLLAEHNAGEAGRQREEKEQQRQKAEARAAEAEQARKRARQALDEMFSQVIDDWLSRQPKLTAVQKAFLHKALAWQEAFTREAGDTPEQRRALARAHNQAARIRVRLGLRAEAEVAFTRAVELTVALVRDHPGDPEYIQALATAHNNLALVQKELGRPEKALQSHAAGRTLQEALVRDHPGTPQYAADLARTYSNQGVLQRRLGLRKEALASYAAALTLQEPLARDHPGTPQYALELAGTHNNLGALQKLVGRRAEALQSLTAARALLDRLVRDHPGIHHYVHGLALTHHNLGGVQAELGRREEALRSFTAAGTLRERLVRDHPGISDYAESLALTRNSLGILQSGMGRPDDALQSFAAARVLLERLVRDYPGTPQYAETLAFTHKNVGVEYRKLGWRKEALASYTAARDLLESLARDHPGVPQYAEGLGDCYGKLGRLVRDGGQLEEALLWFARAIATLTPAVKKEPPLAGARMHFCDAHWGRAVVLARLERHAEALQECERALELDAGKRPLLRLSRALALARQGRFADTLAQAERWGTAEGEPSLTYGLAALYALASTAVKDNAERQEQYATRAIELLRRARDLGYFRDRAHVEDLKQSAGFAPLRPRDAFQKLLAELGD